MGDDHAGRGPCAWAALAEIGGAWLIWQGVREHRGVLFIGASIVAPAAYGFIATAQPEAHFGWILAAYGGIFVVGALTWGVLVDGFRPDRYDPAGAALCLLGVAVIMVVPRKLTLGRHWPSASSIGPGCHRTGSPYAASARSSQRPDPDQRLDGPALVHRPVGLGDAV